MNLWYFEVLSTKVNFLIVDYFIGQLHLSTTKVIFSLSTIFISLIKLSIIVIFCSSIILKVWFICRPKLFFMCRPFYAYGNLVGYFPVDHFPVDHFIATLMENIIIADFLVAKINISFPSISIHIIFPVLYSITVNFSQRKIK